MTAESKSDVDSAASAADIAAAAANVAAAQAASAVAADASSSYQRDKIGTSGYVADFDKDIGADERVEATGPDNWDFGYSAKQRTSVQYQSMDTAEILATSKHRAKMDSQEVRTAEQTILHQAKMNGMELEHARAEHSQRLRHADFQVTALAAVTKEMIDTISDRVVAGVCSRIAA